ncbi:uncharacterized protein LOC144097404 [Amblyomma americanum]
MAAPMPESCAASQQSRADMKRVSWLHHATMTLIRIWEENLPALRACTRNARIYASIAADLSAALHGEGPHTAKQARQKIDNLHKKYRKLKRTGTTTGAGGQDWPFYWHLHRFLGSLPMNNEMLIEENVEMPMVAEMPEDAQLLSWGERVTFHENDDVTGSATLPGNEDNSRLSTIAADVSASEPSSTAETLGQAAFPQPVPGPPSQVQTRSERGNHLQCSSCYTFIVSSPRKHQRQPKKVEKYKRK